MNHGTSPASSSTPRIFNGISLLLLTSSFLIFFSCCSHSNAARDEVPGSYRLSGTIHRVAVEGGCWQLIADTDSTRYQIGGAPADSLHEDGIHAELLVRTLKGASSTCMAGRLVEVIRILRITH